MFCAEVWSRTDGTRFFGDFLLEKKEAPDVAQSHRISLV